MSYLEQSDVINTKSVEYSNVSVWDTNVDMKSGQRTGKDGCLLFALVLNKNLHPVAGKGLTLSCNADAHVS